MTIIPSDQWVQILGSQWNSFQWWFYAYQWTAIIEAIVILVLIVYLGRNHWKSFGRSIFNGLRTANEAINRAQQERGSRKEISVFSIGKFWAFVFSGLFTFLALISVLIMGNFAAVGEGMATNNSTEAIQVAASNNLLWQLSFVQDFLWAVFIISLLVIFRGYIELLWQKLKERGFVQTRKDPIGSWIFQGLRYSILVLFTVFSFLAIYNASLVVLPSIAGSTALTTNIAIGLPVDSYARSWSNLAGIIDPIAYIFLAYWICSVWLMAFGYLLNYELDYLWEKVKLMPKKVFDILKK